MGLVPGAMGQMGMDYTPAHSMDLMPMEDSIQEDRAGGDWVLGWKYLFCFLPVDRTKFVLHVI